MRENAEHRLQALVAEEPRTWCELDNVVGFGRAHREILRTAELESSDLIVMVPRDEGPWTRIVRVDNAAGSAECRVSCFDRARKSH